MTLPYNNKDDINLTGFNTLDDLHKASKKDKTKMEDTSNSSKYSDTSIIKIVNDIAISGNCTIEQAYKGTIVVLNQGGTSPRAQKSIFAKIGSAKITLDIITKSLRKIEGNSATLRKLARSFGTKAFEVCKDLGVKGNLANKILQYDPNLSEEETIWAADFQSANPDCPSKIRDLLQKYYDENVKKSKSK